jgi:hypothetical protein
MFALSKATDVKVKNVITLSQKNRKPDEKPGVKLKLEMQLPAESLEHFGAHLTEFVYEPPAQVADSQATIEGVEPAPKKSARLTQLGAKIAKLPLTFEMTGYTTEIIIGTARPESNILIKDCILSDWVLQFKEGGTVVAGLSLESPDVSKQVLGELGSMKSRTMPMVMTPPEVHQADIEDDDDDGDADSVTPARPRKPGAAEKHAAARAGKDVGPAPAHKTASTVSGEGAWPFLKKDKGADPATPEAALAASGRPAQSRTARGREKTKQALEAGAKAHAEAGAGEAA